MDGQNSHVTANVIVFYKRNAIDLLILPPHCSLVLQSLDLGVFALLKLAVVSETDAFFCLIQAASCVRNV